jgi:hypothetical protein
MGTYCFVVNVAMPCVFPCGYGEERVKFKNGQKFTLILEEPTM